MLKVCRMIERVTLGRCKVHITHAADLLGISRPTLYNLLDKFGLR